METDLLEVKEIADREDLDPGSQGLQGPVAKDLITAHILAAALEVTCKHTGFDLDVAISLGSSALDTQIREGSERRGEQGGACAEH